MLCRIRSPNRSTFFGNLFGQLYRREGKNLNRAAVSSLCYDQQQLILSKNNATNAKNNANNNDNNAKNNDNNNDNNAKNNADNALNNQNTKPFTNLLSKNSKTYNCAICKRK